LAGSLPLEIYLATLNTYYDCVVDAVVEQGGEVLKFIGDGVLAMFPFEPNTQSGMDACEQALAAAHTVFERLGEVNTERSETGLSQINCSIALHAGDVMYGNVGSARRLDFTVTGPTVNEVVRLESICKTLDVPLVISEVVASLTQRPIKSLGLHMLRGVARPMRVFSVLKQSEVQASRTRLRNDPGEDLPLPITIKPHDVAAARPGTLSVGTRIGMPAMSPA
jgi:adenylate cyclase